MQLIPGALSLGVKQLGLEADHSPPTSAEVKKMWIYMTTPPYRSITIIPVGLFFRRMYDISKYSVGVKFIFVHQVLRIVLYKIFIPNVWIKRQKKGKAIPVTGHGGHRVVRHRGSHIF
jgi:hypothetical protein